MSCLIRVFDQEQKNPPVAPHVAQRPLLDTVFCTFLHTTFQLLGARPAAADNGVLTG